MSSRSLIIWFALIAGLELGVRGHLEAAPLRHSAGLALFAVGAIAISRGTRLARWGLTLGLAVAGTGLVDVGLRSARSEPAPVSATESFAEANGDPRAYASWYASQAPTWRALAPPDSARPRAAVVFGHAIARNALGLRGAEPKPAAGRHRIVVMGGATTFDATRADEVSWPRQLEDAIRTRFDCPSPVDVVNGGRPGAPLGGGIGAVARYAEVFAPELILVYPGPPLLDAVLAERPDLHVAPPQPIPARASPLAASLERRWRQKRSDRRWRAALAATDPVEAGPSAVAARYRGLLVEARRRAIDAVVATPALAVSATSPDPVLRFYETAQPQARSWVRARRAHDRILRGVAASYGVRVVDTGAALDESPAGSFRTLTQLAPAGRTRLVDALLDALEPELTRPDPGCVARGSAS